MDQPFNTCGQMLCACCQQLIGRFYVLINEHDGSDYDPQIAVHIPCLTGLADEAVSA